MATTQAVAPEQTRQVGYPADSWLFDVAFAVAISGFMFGMYLDGWAHSHGMVDTSFFTPWHAVLYGMFGVSGAILVGTHFRNVLRGYAWSKALPRGYMFGLIGVMIFAAGGVADMFWHEIFGIEEGIEPLYSPSHLTLAIGAFLVMGAPFIAAWGRRKRLSGWREFLPVLLSATAITGLFTFFMQFSYFGSGEVMRGLMGSRPYSSEFTASLSALNSVFISTVIYGGVLLMLLRRWHIPFGAIAVLFAVNNILMVWMRGYEPIDYAWVVAFAASGLLVDVLIQWLKPSADNPVAVRVIMTIFPFITTLLSLGVIHWMGLSRNGFGLWWEIHMWLGVPVIAALVGLLLSFVAFPPAIPTLDEV